ncbi:TPA: hypothetical protein N0F65_012518 [Lagenidium giganteum]|uniref:RRM domain-containing protein n=1 Tax=Lagenidium giganteum TaxID=4803 RepID=A0AAV2YHM2_9STRA|nr:TPA: hypothetical protein N0F65_012518 [Lagenidium giganteum]
MAPKAMASKVASKAATAAHPAESNSKNADDTNTESTRLYVQNLPAYVDTKRLREHFATQGEVTDAVVVKTKDGTKSRRFGFVGYKTAEQARAAKKFFHLSFLDTCRLNVQVAVAREADDKARPWSKYSAGSSRFQGGSGEDADVSVAEEKGSDGAKTDKKSSKLTKPVAEETSEEFQEFMETMQSRSKTRFWANDDVQGPEAQAAKAEAAKLLHDSEDEEDDVNLELPEDSDDEEDTKAMDMSDMDYLRSKVSKKIDKDDDDSEAEGEDDDMNSADGGDDDDDDRDAKKVSKKGTTSGTIVDADAAVEEKPSSRLFVRNLPYTAVEEDLMDLCSAYGTVTEVHMPLDETKRRKGFGFVQFQSTVDAQAALDALNGFAFQGRLLHVIFAKVKPEKVDLEAALADPNLSYKQKKELERQVNASKKTGWNAAFIRGDATVGSLAERMGVKRGDIMDKENGNMAVRLAIGETMLVKENKDFFAQEGIDLDAIEGALVKKSQQAAAAAKKIERSSTVILVKNLPHTTEEDELAQMFRKFGEISRFVLPPSKTLALVEFLEPSEARKAFRSLAYKKFQHVPLYLEWAPVKVFTKAATASDTTGVKSTTAVVPDVDDQDENASEQNNTICVKNLSFNTKEASLEKLFKQSGKVRKVTVARRKDPKKGLLSMGFGFVEFATAKDAEQAIKSLQGAVVDGHALNLKLSHKKMSQAPKRSADDSSNGRRSKIIVRNVAFEATPNEIRELFGAFGQLKRVRMPKKFDGKHRGFAFVEFLTEQEAKTAFSALSSSHLYGRHLVLEWAEDADDMDTLRAKASRDLSAIDESNRRKRLKAAAEDEREDDGDY